MKEPPHDRRPDSTELERSARVYDRKSPAHGDESPAPRCAARNRAGSRRWDMSTALRSRGPNASVRWSIAIGFVLIAAAPGRADHERDDRIASSLREALHAY